MTTNLASDVLFENYNAGMTSPDDLFEQLRPYLNKYFRPEFLGRLKPIVFLPLNTEAMKPIVEMKLNKIKKRLMQNRKLEVSFDKKVIDDMLLPARGQKRVQEYRCNYRSQACTRNFISNAKFYGRR